MTDENHVFEVEMANHVDDSSINNTIIRSFKLLDTSIQHATNIKKNLGSTFELVIGLMREVEREEIAAEEAKEEAAKSGLDILVKVDELKQTQQRRRETNDMNARELYAQKVVIAKELSKLQLRVSGILNEKDRYLEAFDEMLRALKMRRTLAITEKELADKVKLEKESLAQEALAFEEGQMLKLVKESKKLKLQAVNISMLQDAFKECEFHVNILLEDVYGKYQDINLFRDCLDHQPVLQLSGLLSSSQILAGFDLKDQEGNMNGSFEVKSPSVAADNITEMGHDSISMEASVASARTYAERVAAPIIVRKGSPQKLIKRRETHAAQTIALGVNIIDVNLRWWDM